MTFGTVIAFNLKWSETLDNMKGCGAMVFTCSPLLPHSGYCFMGINFFFHVSWWWGADIVMKLALTQERKGVFLKICCKFIWAKRPVAALLLIHARQKFTKPRIDTGLAFSADLHTYTPLSCAE